MTKNTTWLVATDRAVSVDRHGGCYVDLSRLVEDDVLGQVFEELGVRLYGPVEYWNEQIVFV